MANVDKLKALLEADEAGEKIAALINEFLIDEDKRDLLLVKLNEAKKEIPMLRTDVRLVKSEETVKGLVLSANRPLNAKELTELAPSYLPSLRHRSHMSGVLNSLVSKGVLGKVSFGNVVYFVSSREAVKEELKRRQEPPTECSPDEIARETGMPLAKVLNVLKELAG